jgi:exopolyphosphatase/guanosine-5'-triphosphate,3'-diphosphate pyrophosphatase
VDKLAFPSLSSERQPVFAGGVAVLSSVFKALEIKQMMVSSQALREGLLYDMIGRIRHEDVRDATVAALIKRYDLDMEQAQRVETTAKTLMGQLNGAWTIRIDEGERMLSWACRLHEIGVRISHSQYQKHGSYIVQNADLPGFTRRQQHLLAALVLGHRRKLSPVIFDALPEPERASALYLCILLRLGVLLHRSRSTVNRPSPKLKIEGKTIRIRFPDKWLRSHPLTRAELEQEAKRLKPVGFKLRYE